MTEKDVFLESLDISINDLKSLIDSHSVFAVTDIGGMITFANDKFVELSKYSREELIGSGHNILRSDEHSDEFFDEMWQTILSRKIWHGDIKNKAKDGSHYWLKTTILPLLHEGGNIMGFATLRTDITEQKKQQELLEETDELLEIKNLKLEAELLEKQKQNILNERMSSIGQLASRLAHDIRNPLSIIRTSSENLIFQYGIDDSKRVTYDRISRSIDRITHQINDVLDFVKGCTPKLSKVKFSNIIAESIDSLTIPDDIELVLPKNDVEFLADKKLFSVVMNNLILNGIQAIDSIGIVEITVEENNDEIIIQVEDSGEGIPKQNLEKIFDLLYTTKMQGTGLGLSSVKSIIISHGGRISVTSPPTIFTITLTKVNS